MGFHIISLKGVAGPENQGHGFNHWNGHSSSKYHSLDVFTKDGGKVTIPLDEVQKCVRPACHLCSDMTAEFSDISVGSARLPEGWEEARSWNQVIVRTEAGQKLMALAKNKGVLEFREVPEGNLERLKKASLNKKKAGAEKSKTL